MIKMLMYGACGAMGRVITRIVSETEGIEITAGVDLHTEEQLGYPLFSSVAEAAEALGEEGFDVVVDFSSPAAVDLLLDYCETHHTPAVICTTGLSQTQIQRIEALAEQMPMLRSANMSIGINLLLKLVKEAARTLYPQNFDIEIVEQHHHRKKDAPSGTALALADSINDALEGALHYVYDRSQVSQPRAHEELGLSAVRGGSIVGVHDVIFAGEDEVITISHTAYSRGIFAKGAVAAAMFLAGKSAGLYTMQDVV